MIALTPLLAPEFPAGEVIGLRSGTPVTRGEFLAGVQRWRDTLAARPGSAWALRFQGSVEFACAMIGGWQAGKHLLLPGEPQPRGSAWLDSMADGFLGEFETASTLTAPARSAPGARPVCPQPETLAAVVFTSGTTGQPVAAPKTFRQLESEVQALHALWGEQAGTSLVLSSVPHHHFYGLLFKILWPLCRQAPFVGETLPLPHEVSGWLQRRPGAWVASPTVLSRVTPGPLCDATRDRLRAVFSSGGPLPLEVAQRCAAAFGQGVQEIYGSSETGGVGCRCRTHEERAWRPMPGVSVRLAEGDVLCLRSPWLTDAGEWRTADRAALHADGTFSLRGRADRIVKVGEKRVSLTVIEAQLTGCRLVRDARAVLLAEGRTGVAVLLEPEGEALLDREGERRVVEQLAALLHPYVPTVGLPRRWRFVETLPANAMGKVTDEAVRGLFGE